MSRTSEPMRGGAPASLGSTPLFLLVLALSGCQSVDPTAGLSPGAAVGSGISTGVAAEPEPVPIAVVAPAGTIGPVQFLPLVGAPVAVADMLSAALGSEAARAGVGIEPSDAPATPLRLKGYLSALAEGRDTVVVYVWDVVDPAGNRISRIQGQERAFGTAKGGDPWAGVDQATTTAIARRTMDDLAGKGTSG